MYSPKYIQYAAVKIPKLNGKRILEALSILAAHICFRCTSELASSDLSSTFTICVSL